MTDEEKRSIDNDEAQEALRAEADSISEDDLGGIFDNASQKIGNVNFESIADKGQVFLARLKLLLRILGEVLNGTYEMPWSIIASIAGALLYFINPIDLIPDVIPIIGYLDDAAVFAFLFNFITPDLEAYCKERNLKPEEYGLGEED